MKCNGLFKYKPPPSPLSPHKCWESVQPLSLEIRVWKAGGSWSQIPAPFSVEPRNPYRTQILVDSEPNSINSMYVVFSRIPNHILIKSRILRLPFQTQRNLQVCCLSRSPTSGNPGAYKSPPPSANPVSLTGRPGVFSRRLEESSYNRSQLRYENSILTAEATSVETND